MCLAEMGHPAFRWVSDEAGWAPRLVSQSGYDCGLSWDEAHRIMERAVARGLMRRPLEVPRNMGIDEKTIAKGHRYVTLVNDLDHGHVIEVAEDRTTTSVTQCLGKFSMNDLANNAERLRDARPCLRGEGKP